MTFPTITGLPDGAMLATWRVGSEKDCADERIEFSRSTDDGRTWNAPVDPFGEVRVGSNRGSLKICYLTALAPGRLVAAAMWVDRTRFPGKPLFNAETEGCLPMAILTSQSSDNGQSWTDWSQVSLPQELGPPSLTSPLLVMDDGSWLISIETNKPYLDASPWKQKAVFVRSHDQGKNWSAPVDVAFDESGRIFNWDLRCAVTDDGNIGSFAWTYDRELHTYLNIHRRISADGGHHWSAPEDLGITDQAGRPAVLKDGRVLLPWVDRFHSRTIKVRVASSIRSAFPAGSEIVIHRQDGAKHAEAADTGDLLAEMGLWNFGLPYAAPTADGGAIITYYAGSTSEMSLHWVRLSA